jgi:hypothetical protein
MSAKSALSLRSGGSGSAGQSGSSFLMVLLLAAVILGAGALVGKSIANRKEHLERGRDRNNNALAIESSGDTRYFTQSVDITDHQGIRDLIELENSRTARPWKSSSWCESNSALKSWISSQRSFPTLQLTGPIGSQSILFATLGNLDWKFGPSLGKSYPATLLYNIDQGVDGFNRPGERVILNGLYQTTPAISVAGRNRFRIPYRASGVTNQKTQAEAQRCLNDTTCLSSAMDSYVEVNGQTVAMRKIFSPANPLTIDNWPWPFGTTQTRIFHDPPVTQPMPSSPYQMQSGLVFEFDENKGLLSCYDLVTPRSLCLDLGGVFDPSAPEGAPQCLR